MRKKTEADGDTTSDELTDVTATIAVEKVVKALKLNDTPDVDDRVIAVSQSEDATATIRTAFRGTERYSNPSAAPVHIRPEELVEDEFSHVPRRSQVDHVALDVPKRRAEWTEEDKEAVEEAHEVLLNVWETDVSGMIEGAHEVVDKGCQITLVGVEEGDDA